MPDVSPDALDVVSLSAARDPGDWRIFQAQQRVHVHALIPTGPGLVTCIVTIDFVYRAMLHYRRSLLTIKYVYCIYARVLHTVVLMRPSQEPSWMKLTLLWMCFPLKLPFFRIALDPMNSAVRAYIPFLPCSFAIGISQASAVSIILYLDTTCIRIHTLGPIGILLYQAPIATM